MASEVRNIAAFRIEGDLDDLQLVLLSETDDELIRYRLTAEIIFKLAIEIPRYIGGLANGGTIDNVARPKF